MTFLNPTDEQVTAMVATLVRTKSVAEAARLLNLSRGTVTSVAAGAAKRGTLALLRERLRERPELLALHHPTERQA